MNLKLYNKGVTDVCSSCFQPDHIHAVQSNEMEAKTQYTHVILTFLFAYNVTDILITPRPH